MLGGSTARLAGRPRAFAWVPRKKPGKGSRKLFLEKPITKVGFKGFVRLRNGDNRDSSQDSRVMSQVGLVPAVIFVSRAEVLWFSQNGTASWWQIWRWPQAIRFGRIGKEID